MSRSESIPFVQMKDDWNETGYYWCFVVGKGGYIHGPVVIKITTDNDVDYDLTHDPILDMGEAVWLSKIRAPDVDEVKWIYR
jgi:hypothetical protein